MELNNLHKICLTSSMQLKSVRLSEDRMCPHPHQSQSPLSSSVC